MLKQCDICTKETELFPTNKGDLCKDCFVALFVMDKMLVLFEPNAETKDQSRLGNPTR